MNKTYNIIWNAARGMYIVTSELARSGSRAIVSVSASCAVTLLAMDAAPAVAEETRVSIPTQTTTYTLSGATPFVVETGNTVATDTATSAAIVGDNSNDWDLLIESGAVVGSSLTDSQAMNLDSLTGATSVHNQGTITGSNEDGTILLQNGGSVINDARIENSATYEHDPEDIPQEYAGVYMLNGGSYVSSESGVLEGVSGVIVQSGEAHITNGGMINSDGSWRSYGVEFRDGTYGTIVNTGTIITTASDGSGKIEDAAIYVHTLNDMAVSGSVSVDNSGLMQSDFITVALYYGSHFEVVNRAGGVITAGNSSLVGIKSTAMELKVGVDNLVTNDGTISAYGTANTYGIHYGESTSGGVITNTGSITTTGGGSGDASVYVHGNGDGTVVNNSGTMSSTVYGVYLDSARSKGHTLNNQAGSAISANTAVAINGNGNTITNQGKMTGVSDGLLISGNNNIVTTSGGEISGKNGIRVSKGSGNQITAKSGSKITTTSTGISIAGGNNQITTESGSAIVAKDNGILINSGANNVTNGGSITATGSNMSYGIQYNSGASGTITNTGTITTTGKGAGDASVYAHGGAVTINNSGTMDSSVFGVYVTTGHTLNNLAGGSISANTAVQFHGNNNKLANAGAILGDTNGVTISGSGNTLTSQGKITGGTNAILINSGSKNNTLTLNTGTEISGSITDDNNSASANNNLILDGEGTLGSSISGLNSVTSSGDWTLSGATMNFSGTTNSALWVKSGTLILNGAMTAKGATVDSGTTLQIGNSGTLGAFNGDIVDNGTLTFNRSDAAAYGSVISGSGNVIKQGGGELTLSNNNSYSGGTTIAEGTLTATAGGALGSGNIDNRAYLKLDAASASDPFIVADLTTHSGATVEIGAGSTLQANTLTQQDGSTLTADLTATSGPAIRAKNVNLDGTLNVASPASQEPIRSTDDLISLALIESDNAISGDFDGITINGSAMNPDAFITVVGQKNVNDTHYDLVETLTWYADRDNAAIDAHGTFNLADADDSFTVNTVLENVDANSGWNGQSLTKTGAGTLILNAENTYTGSTTISEGTLIATNVEALGTGNVTDNATLEMNTGGDFDNAISGSGQVVKSGDETLTLSGANSYTGGTTISGGTLVASNVEALGTGDITDNAVLELNTGGDFDNAISGSGQVVKSGDETLTLSGANSYTGGTTISGGTLVASNVEALGSGDVTDNATLELNTGGDFDNNIGGTGSVVKSGDKTLTLSGANSYTGGTTISGGTLVATNVEALGSGDVTDNATLELNTGGDFDNAISGSGQVVKSGDKTLTLSGANSYSGATTISGGTLIATHVNALGTGAIDNRASLLLDASGQFTVTDLTTESGGNTEIGAGSTLQATTLTQKSDSTLTINLNSNTTAPVIHAASQVSLAGTLDITGVGDVLDSDPASTDDLDTFTLIASDKTIAGDFEKLTVAGMDADLADFITVDGRIDDTGKQYELTTALTWYADRDDAVTDAHGTFNLTNADGSFAVNTVLENVDATLDPASATGWDGTSLIKQGAGTLILNAENTYTGGTTISGGTLVATNVDALGTGDVTDDATLELNTGGTFDNAISGSGQVVKSGDETLTLSGTNTYSGGTLISGGTLVASNVEALGTGDVTNDAVLELNTSGDFDNALSGSGQVEKSGDGTLTLSGSNTYTGGTLISGGTLVASNVEALGTGDVTNDAVLELNTGGTFDNAISGSGQVVKSGDDALTLSGSNTYTGGTIISGGTLVATNVDALGSGDVTDNATLELNTGGTFDNAISGSGQVVKSGDDVLTLSGANSYSGGTLISDGTLVASNVEALGTGDVTDNATLELNTGGTFDNAISGSGQVEKSGDGTLTLSGSNTYTGGTLISGGTLVASNVEALGSGDVTNDAVLELNTGGDFTNNISGSGQVVKSGDETLTLSGANSYTGGTLISSGTLVANDVNALGTGDVTDDATLELNTGGDFDNAISGSGQVVKSGDDVLTLSGANSYSGGTLISDGTLVASNVEALGTGDVTDNATLELNTGGTFDNAISGSGQVEKSGDGALTLSGANSYSGGTLISDGTLIAGRVDVLGSGDVTDNATLELNTGGTFDNAISGSGQVVKSGDETLTLSGANSYTGGTLISSGTLVANDVNALGTGDVTDNAVLELNTGGDFDNAISGSGKVEKSGDGTLTLSGSNTYTGGTTISGGTLVATSVEALGSGDVTDNAVLELNTGGTFDNVISGSGQVVKSGDDALTLSGANTYTGGTTINGGTLVASNVEALGSGDIDNYASLQLNASGQFVTANLTTHDNATTAIGAGSALRANTLTQEANSTLAVHLTDSNSGAIVTADRANLGGTLDITGIGNVAKSWTRDAYAYTLIDTDSAINSDFAQFTVAGMDAKQVDFLTVDGRVNADDDTRYDVTASLSWYADSDNAATDAHGTFTLSEQGHSFTLNTALTDVDATLNPDSATYWDGKSLIKRGAGALILGAQNTYSGDTDVQEGALWLAETATIGSAGSAQAINIAANAAFGGHNATVNGHVNNLGSLYFADTFTVNGDVVNSSAMISGSDQPNNTLTIAGNYTGNDGHLYLNTQLGDDSSPTDKLIVTGDTAGSTTLHITNVNGLGAKTVNGIEVIEVGGQSDGDFTLYKGHVDINAWTYTLKQDGGDWYLRSESDDVPDDGGDVTPPDDGGDVTPPDDGGDVTPPDDGGDVTPPDDGGDVTPPDDGGDVTPPDDGGDITPPDGGGDITPPDDGGDVTPPDDDGEVTPPDDGGDVTPPDDDGDITPPDGGDGTPVAPQYRADIGVYLGNQWMARNLQMQTLYDREGSQYRSADGSVWMRFKAGKAESQAVNGNVDIDSDYSQFQLGGDILTWSDGAQSVTVGLMGSYINASTDSTGNRGADGSQFSANGSVDGYNLGLYATWFADAQSHRGAYIDSWYQYGAYNNSVDNDGLSASRYDSAAHAVSLETGYRYDIALSNRNTVSLTPQAQVTWQRYSADTVIDDGGTRISGQNDDSWTTRLGVRVDGKLYKESGRIQPFMEVNWLHASDNASATFGDTKVSQDLPNDRVEVKVGIQANVSERLSVYAQAAGQKGKNDYGDASFSLNMRYNW
ncbi:TPA: autotransporter-associated beta strand repeat-containing protein [Salmonella enterica subsp. enterica serovar Tennessee]|uniref:Autotransporter outer membrane beta-barrel domain-containing protein n=5 Tax=Salmonella enterica TaxID=28901 RepID=A0A6Y4HI53_SALET|nr:autotransporter outer membrane beta-barrel domain-containing protein [Salmonella enterica]EBO6134946.1 autotransporter outer membrane beta-barrel domain-containing protein [Salmonella enterica]HAB5644057.1 autotransporter outer membrane beta-barrel domain-containing protein [Salmonella enterica subsp. enterica serovar Tennessee]HEC6446593.1 autotransporter-associated beta strand repeat-containing protein [Salmonella enterica subsp. enterica serovar Tennessee]HEC6921992.1 autotransporter-asso